MTFTLNGHSSDEHLMTRAQAGERKAFEELYDKYAPILYAYFFRMLRKDKVVAEDYTQELFLKIIQHQDKYDPKRKFKTWIFSMAHNMCKNNYRKAEVEARAASELKIMAKSYTPADSHLVDNSLFKQELEGALQKLNAAKRSSFIMRFKYDLSIKEIARIEEVSEGTIKSRIFYTLKELTTQLKEFNPKFRHESA